MKTIVSVSGGLGSAFALDMCIKRYGKENVVAVFADVKGTGYSHFWSEFPHLEYLLHERFGGETRDTYEFLWHLSYALDIPIERLEDGASIWGVAGKSRAFQIVNGNNRLCKASELLKRMTMAAWIEQNFKQGDYRIALGMGIFEGHRVEKSRYWWTERMGYEVDVFSPMIEAYKETKSYSDNCTYADWGNKIELVAPKAYAEDLAHNNCAAKCFMAGQNQWVWVYENDHDGYMYSAYQENNIRRVLGVDATILKMERDGVADGISLFTFIEHIKSGDYNKRDLGGSCGCFTSSGVASLLSQAPLKETKKRRLPA
jgi:hypothetical protein